MSNINFGNILLFILCLCLNTFSVIKSSQNNFDITAEDIPRYRHDNHGYPTLRPRRVNCTPPTVELFPSPFISPEIRNHGGIVFHIILAIYTFVGQIIICSKYFVPSIEKFKQELKLPQHVVGVSFMAIGSSAPQLTTCLVGVLFAKDDIGVSSVTQSSVFKLFCIIPICIMFTRNKFKITKWPFARDLIFYFMTVTVMLVVIYNEVISWPEALAMVLLYGGYCIILKCEFSLKKLVQQLAFKTSSYVPQTTVSSTNDNMNVDEELETNGDVDGVEIIDKQINRQSSKLFSTIFRWIALPTQYLCRLTIPDVKRDQCKSYYLLTYLILLVWISIYSYLMVWMITIIGFTFGIPDSIMSVTFFAAAVTVPAIINSISAINRGLQDMMISNILGSVIFDLLVCLGLSWFIQTAVILPGSHVNIFLKGLIYPAICLIFSAVFVLVAIHLYSWKFDNRLGFVLMIGYLVYATSSSLYELNVFGEIHFLECRSNY